MGDEPGWEVQTAMVMAPLATPALIPEGESSRTRHFSMGYPSSLAARRNGSGKGLPRRRRGSSAVMVIRGRVIPARRRAPWQSAAVSVTIVEAGRGKRDEQVLAPEVATANRPLGRESMRRRTPGRILTDLFWHLRAQSTVSDIERSRWASRRTRSLPPCTE
jgi:hypothetical protein